jgi:heat shock protein HslJ
MNIRRAIGTVAFTALLAACATGTQEPSPTPRPVLVDTEWVLISLDGSPLIEQTQITLNLGEASLDGSAGCNTYGASYAAAEDSLRLSGLYWTEMGCTEPEGVMDQEQAYLDALSAAARFRLDGDGLEVYDEAGASILAFAAKGAPSSVLATPVPEPTVTIAVAGATRTSVNATATDTPLPAVLAATPEPPTAVPPTPEPPAGFVRYVDAASGVSLFVPDSWTIMEPDPRGGTTIFMSYPEDKYTGGGRREPGDSKCDLTIHPPGVSVADIDPELNPTPRVTVVSRQEIILQSGRPGLRFEIESLGPSLSLFTEINGRAVVLTCFGELAPFDEIAVTLGAAEAGPAVAQGSDLRATIDVPASLDSGATVTAIFTLTNTSSEGFYVLKWFTPLEGIGGDIFRVERDGAELPYHGKLVKRGPPLSEDYVWLDAGQSVSAEVNLAEGYDFSQAGTYTVQFRSPQISHVAKTENEKADSFEELAMVHIPSNTASVVIADSSSSQ